MRAPLAAFCCGRGIKGTLLLAHEGINGTVAGSEAAIAELIDHLEAIDGLAGLEVKYSSAAEMPFHRMKVRLKREIVTMGVEDIDPATSAGTYVAPADWNALISRSRHDRHRHAQRLRGVDRHLQGRGRSGDRAAFANFPAWVEAHRAELEGRKVAMFCTGGIRCEKATAYVKSLGFEDVFHLKGGILKYLEEVPAEQSLWQGECFVFDERVSVSHGLDRGRGGTLPCLPPSADAPSDRRRRNMPPASLARIVSTPVPTRTARATPSASGRWSSRRREARGRISDPDRAARARGKAVGLSLQCQAGWTYVFGVRNLPVRPGKCWRH